MSFDPCFLRLSVPEVDLLTRAGGPNGWSVGRVVESLERPALNSLDVYLANGVTRGYELLLRYVVGGVPLVRALTRPVDIPAEVSSASSCACMVMWGFQGREVFELATAYLFVSPEGRIQRSIGFPQACAEVSEEMRAQMVRNVDHFFALLVGIEQVILHAVAAPVMCSRRRSPFPVPLARGAAGKPGRVRIFRLSPSAGSADLSEAVGKLPPEPAPRVRHCPAWSVRGHYRRLRSGRTVYVKPCVKGPERLAASVPGREYCLELGGAGV